MVYAGNLSRQRVAIYARYSSASQREASIEDQVRRCRAFVEAAGGAYDPELVFTDHAVSGASLQRPAFEKLMSLVNAKHRVVDAIVTEDLSRVTRDFADGATVFKTLQYLGVPLLGVADGIDTSARGAKMNFTLKSLLADMYIDDLRDKTLRGLEGRALAGYSTGGLPYGYRSRAEVDAQRRVLGHVIEVDEAQAAVVRRIFEEYIGGRSLTAIATLYNAEEVPPPRAHSPGRRTGWVASTVRAMLHNAAYVGCWTFKRRTWVKVPGTNRRCPRDRAAAEVMELPRPHLRIIDEELWAAVKGRLRAVCEKFTAPPAEGRSGPSTATRATPYLLSTILVCDRCGAHMTISGGSNGRRYYRCGDNFKRGTCQNRLSVREDVARTRILGAVRESLTRPEGILYASSLLDEAVSSMAHQATAKRREHEDKLKRIESRIRGVMEAIGDGDRSTSIMQTLRDWGAAADDARRSIDALRSHETRRHPLPNPEKLVAQVFALEENLMDDVVQGREVLRALFADGQVRLEPQPDGVYLARSALQPLALLAPETETPEFAYANSGVLHRLVAGAGFEPTTFGL